MSLAKLPVNLPVRLPRLPRPGFPFSAPTVPDTVEALPPKARLGADYETFVAWIGSPQTSDW